MLSIVISHHVIDCAELVGAVEEPVPVLYLRLTPLHFAKSRKAREEHVMEVVRGCDVLCPEVSLHSEYMSLLFVSHVFSERLI